MTADVAAVTDSSESFSSRIGDHIGFVNEGRFLDGHVVILDRHEPHLRLFALDGRFLWAGSRTGGGPSEMQRGHSIAAGPDGRLLVLEHGRVSEWRLQRDTLAFQRVYTMPARYFPLGAVSGCDGDWLLYARDQEMFDTTTWQVKVGPEVNYLHALHLTDAGVVIRPLWAEARSPHTIAVTGHSGVLIGRSGRRVVMLHRAGAWSPGEIIEFDCAGRPLRSQSEGPLITGDSMAARIPEPQANQWTSGVAALGNAWILALQRPFPDRLRPVFVPGPKKTELFYSERGKVLGSVILNEYWMVLDYHPDHGVLMSATEPVPHFIRVPVSALRPQGE